MEFTWDNLVAFINYARERDDLYVTSANEDHRYLDGDIYRQKLEEFVQSTTKEDL